MKTLENHGLKIEVGSAGSGSGGPGAGGMTTNDTVVWARINGGRWRRPATKSTIRFVDSILDAESADAIMALLPDQKKGA